MKFEITLSNGTVVVPTKQQLKKIYELLFADEPLTDGEAVSQIKESRQGKRAYNAILGRRAWTEGETERLLQRVKELKAAGSNTINKDLSLEFNRSSASLSVRRSYLHKKGLT